MAYFFVEEVLKASKLIGKIEDYSIRDYLKFGVENSSGYTENIFNDNFSGVELTITLPILKKYLCACDEVKPKIQYIDSDSTLKSENFGTLITCTPTGSCADGTVNVNKSDATLISAETVTSGGTTNYNVGDSEININAVKLADVKATDSLSITVVDSLDASVSVTLSGGNKITVPSLPAAGAVRSSEMFRDGQTSSYTTGDEAYLLGNGVDFYTLSENNPFGNAYRFTDFSGNDWDTGTPTGVHIIDWATADYVNETVVVWWQGFISTSVWATAMSTLTTDQGSSGYASGWLAPNRRIAMMVIDEDLATLPTFFTTPNQDFWCSNTRGNSTTNAFYCKGGRDLMFRSKTSSEQGRQVRLYTFAEVGV